VILRTAFVLAGGGDGELPGREILRPVYLSSQTRVQLSSRTLSVIHSITNQITVTVYYDKTDDWYPSIIALLNEYRSANPKIPFKTVDYMRDAGEAQKIKAQYKLGSATDKDLVIFDCDDRVKVVNGKALTQVKLEQVPNATEREFRRKPVVQRRRDVETGFEMRGHIISSAGFPRAQGQEQKEKRGAHIKNHRPRVHHAAGKIMHLFEQAKIRDDLGLPLPVAGSASPESHGNSVTPSTKLIIAAAICVREMAEAKQPSDKNRQPVRKMPRYIPPTVPASSAVGWLVKCRTTNRHAIIGSHPRM